MAIDYSFLTGGDIPAEMPVEATGKPTEPREGARGINYPPKTNAPYRASQSITEHTADKEIITTAQKIIQRNKIAREITEGVITQLEKDLADGKDNLPILILFLSEALDRASGGGDQYIKRAERALKDRGLIS